MFSDLTSRPLTPNAYSDQQFALLEPAAQRDLSNIISINLIENGDRVARENWQHGQLTSLLRHAHARSKFWRRRMPSRMINHGIMKYLPVQSRQDIAAQVEIEGSLIAADGNASHSTYASTGSTGVPVKVHISGENGYYNDLRSVAQFFFDDLSLDDNRVRIRPRHQIRKHAKEIDTCEAVRNLGWALGKGIPYRSFKTYKPLL